MRWGLYFGGGRRDSNRQRAAFIVIWLGSIVVYFISFLLTRVLSRYRELCADRSGAYLTGKPSALASALTKITGEMARIPTRDLREDAGVQRLHVRAGVQRRVDQPPCFLPTRRWSSGSSSWPRSPPTCPARRR